MCVRVADDLKLFDILSERAPDSMNVKAVAAVSGAQEQLLLRLLRTLAGMGFVRQTGKEDFAATPVSMHMTKASVRAGVRYL
jgi:DNA-binding IclR family transcriptional regulator